MNLVLGYLAIGAYIAAVNAYERAHEPPELRSSHPWHEAGMAVACWLPVGVAIGALWVKASCGKGVKRG